MEVESFLNKVGALGLIKPYIYVHLESCDVKSEAVDRASQRYLKSADTMMKLLLIVDKYSEKPEGFSMRECASLFEGSDEKYFQGAMNQLRGKFREQISGYYGLVNYSHAINDDLGMQRYFISPTKPLQMFISEVFENVNDHNLSNYAEFLYSRDVVPANIQNVAESFDIKLSDEYVNFYNEFKSQQGSAA